MTGLKSQSFFTLLTAFSPWSKRSCDRLLACIEEVERFEKKYPRYVLLPSFGTMFVSTPLDRASAARPLVVTVISWTVPVLTTSVVL